MPDPFSRVDLAALLRGVWEFIATALGLDPSVLDDWPEQLVDDAMDELAVWSSAAAVMPELAYSIGSES